MLDGRMNQLSAQNASNVLLAAAICQRRSFSEGTLTDAVTKVATEGNPQEVSSQIFNLQQRPNNPFLPLKAHQGMLEEPLQHSLCDS